MTAKFRARVPQSWWISIGVIAVSLIIAGVSFCVFDADHGGRADHGMPLDLCHALLASALTLPVLTGLSMNGWVTAVRPARVPVRFLHVPARPPSPLSPSVQSD
jgi:hypothetical protein